MAFLKFQRDKRGVENFFIVQPTTNRRGKVRPRVLYWFRSPPDIKVGRQPFEAATRRALEAQHPDVAFDWRSIVETPIPSADADKWRERRRAEKAAKHAAAAEAAAEAVETTDGDQEPAIDEIAAEQPEGETASAPMEATPADAPRDPMRDANGKRRRRRRGGHSGRGPSTPTGLASTPPSNGEPSGD